MLNQKISRLYLVLVPPITAILGFGVGHVAYTVYLPVWLLNVALMLLACRSLGWSAWTQGNPETRRLALAGFFLIAPWMLISMFAGLGPPPETAAGWVELATEQKVRYSMLVGAGVFAYMGFSLLRSILDRGERNIAGFVGMSLITLALPLFLINMIYWGFYLPELFSQQIAAGLDTRPDWAMPVRSLFGMISIVEVGLTYLATALFISALQGSGVLGITASRVIMTVSVLGAVITLSSTFLPDPFLTAGSVASIPAFPLLIPYYLGFFVLEYSNRN